MRVRLVRGPEGALQRVSQPPEGVNARVTYIDVAGIREAVGYEGTYDLDEVHRESPDVADAWAFAPFYMLGGSLPSYLPDTSAFVDVDWYVTAVDTDEDEPGNRWESGYVAGPVQPSEETGTDPSSTELTVTPDDG